MDFKDCTAPVDEDMRAVDALIRDRLRSDVTLINEIAAHILRSGGKRLRPVLVLLAARAFGRCDQRGHLVAAIVELIHTATLLHDDVVDETERRRGQATANAAFGNAGAVLSGDFLYSRSFQLMVEVDDMRIMRELADTTNAIAEGEVLQLMRCGDPDADEAGYLEVIERKTARLFRAATGLGALIAGADADGIRAAQDYGLSLGMAFQVVDDLLDYLADPEVSGKNLGTDLAEGKPTLPLIRAMSVGDAATRDYLRGAISDGGSADVAAVLRAVESTDAIHYTSAAAQRHAADAKQALAAMPPSAFRDAMGGLADFTVKRAS